MNKSALVIASTVALFAIFITGNVSSTVFAQIQSTQSAIQSAQPGQPSQPQQLGQSTQPGPTTQSDHSGLNQTGQAKGPLDQIGSTLSKIIGQK
jgi:hypothetical protein